LGVLCDVLLKTPEEKDHLFNYMIYLISLTYKIHENVDNHSVFWKGIRWCLPKDFQFCWDAFRVDHHRDYHTGQAISPTIPIVGIKAQKGQKKFYD